ncbi:phage tail length tape measure family protein [Pararhizobium antarcticum]|uniref:Bacteriophage tail tape measure N-terminal domain-containing protein n=1 Tax=Pararhizobium antarcticum TaxID=1798805 RepID=A0A657LTQ8_9HYPH|nr:phage tail length tape measure family protein [Pararhizobium antarcticum]OJF97569.1 hypothetical protein AX760_16530 [Pararhizobium antarcticum]
MSDVAQLGIQVTNKGVKESTDGLDKLSGAAARAEAASNGLTNAAKGAASAAVAAARAENSRASAVLAAARASGTASKEVIAAAQAEKLRTSSLLSLARAERDTVAAASAAAAAAGKSAAANDNAASAADRAAAANKRLAQTAVGIGKANGAAAANTANLAAQFQDIGVTAAMGMSPLQIALQQGTQISAVLGPMGAAGALKSLGTSFMSVISPVSLAVIAIIAIVAAGLQMVGWAKLASSVLSMLADSLEMIAPYAIGAAVALALLYAPAIIGGIISVIALLGRLAVAAVTAGAAMLIAFPVLAIIAGIVAIVAAANIFRDELAQIFGRDIVADAKDAANFIIGVFVGAFNAIKATWSALPAALGDFVYSTASAVVNGTELMVNKVVSKIDSLIAKINASMKKLPFGLGDSISVPKIGEFDFGDVPNPYKGSGAAVVEKAAAAMKAAQGTDYVGGVMDVIAKGASAASEKLKDLAKGLTDVDAKTKKGKSGGESDGKSETEKYSDIVDGAERRIAALNAERSAIGLSEEASAALRYETDLLNQAQQRGLVLTEGQKGNLSGLAQVMASVEAATKKARDAFEFAKDATRGFLDDFKSGLKNGEGVWESFGNAALGVLDKISDKLLNDVVDALFEVNSAGAGSGGGILSGILGLFGGGGGASDPWAGLRGYASGTPAARSGVAWVGEKGPELVRFKGGEEVIPSHKLKASNSNRGAANSNAAPVNVSYAPVYNVQGYGKDIESLKAQMQRDQADFKAKVVSTVRDARNSRVKGI